MSEYKEKVVAIICPRCGSKEWKKHGMVSCSVVPFEAICANDNCGYRPDVITNRRLCPTKEFRFRNRRGNIIRHLECHTCGRELLEFEMTAGRERGRTVIFGGGFDPTNCWILPDGWYSLTIDTTDFDGNPITEPIAFCSSKCKEVYRKAHGGYDADDMDDELYEEFDTYCSSDFQHGSVRWKK